MKKQWISSRERKYLSKKRKWIKHWEWNWIPHSWPSRAYLKLIKSKIHLKMGKK